jgi:hypothetical protein
VYGMPTARKCPPKVHRKAALRQTVGVEVRPADLEDGPCHVVNQADGHRQFCCFARAARSCRIGVAPMCWMWLISRQRADLRGVADLASGTMAG